MARSKADIFDGNELLFGIGFLIFGLFILVITIKDALESDKDDYWAGAMSFKGLVGGLGFVLIGLILLVRS